MCSVLFCIFVNLENQQTNHDSDFPFCYSKTESAWGHLLWDALVCVCVCACEFPVWIYRYDELHLEQVTCIETSLEHDISILVGA